MSHTERDPNAAPVTSSAPAAAMSNANSHGLVRSASQTGTTARMTSPTAA